MNEEKKVEKREIKMDTKEEALKALENLSVMVYSRMKGKGLGLIEKLVPTGDGALEPTKTLYTSYVSAVSNDVSKVVKRAIEILKNEA